KYYDLPTEAEWEYACRAGSTTAYCNGDGLEALKKVGWCSYDGNYGSAGKTKPVKSFEPNAWGLYDMHGNAWEGGKDGKRTYPDKETAKNQKDPIEDPEGPLNGDSRVLRGGSWDVYPRYCRSADRNVNAPDYRDYSVGFRVVLRPGPGAP